MANIHILDNQAGRVLLVLHIAIPAGNNSAGMAWRAALLRTGGGTTMLPDGDGTLGTISAAEKASVLAGAIYEVMINPKRFVGAAGPALDALHTQVSSETLAGLQVSLANFGATR